jgi:predicted MFS family arabinose efflux permease
MTALAASPQRSARESREILVMISGLLLFESSIYSAITPLLPHYEHVFHVQKPAIGLLAASYAAGMIPGALLGGRMAGRGGVRATTLAGLLVFSVSIAAFGFGSDLVVLDSLRFIQGAACGLIWGGGLTWAIALGSRERRGELIGTVLAAAIFGSLVGPVIGTLAAVAGTQVIFSLVGAVSLALGTWVLRHPEPPRPERATSTPVRIALRSPQLRLGFWLIVVEAATIGAASTLIPLHLAAFGASAVGIGATFLVTSLISTVLARPVGRLVDRRGPRRLLLGSLTGTAVLLAGLTLSGSAGVLAVMTVVTLGVPLTAYATPAMSIMTEASERSGIALAITTMMFTLAWAFGEAIGAPTAASLAHATTEATPILLLAGIMLLTLWPVHRIRLMSAHR